jgi:hypothetical protein
MNEQASETALSETPQASVSDTPQTSPEPGWRDGLSQENRDHGSIKNFKTVNDLAQSHIHAQKMLGSSVQIPGESATREDWNKFYSRTGRPEQADGYNFAAVKAPKGFTVAEELVSGFGAAAHGSGLSQQQAANLMSWYVKASQGEITAAQQRSAAAKQASSQTLRKDWGNDYDRNVQAVNTAMSRFFPEHLQQQVMEVALTNADFAKALSDIGSRMGEDTTAGVKSTPTSKDRRSEIEAELKALRHDFDGAYLNARHPNHNDEVTRVAVMLEELNGLQR